MQDLRVLLITVCVVFVNSVCGNGDIIGNGYALGEGNPDGVNPVSGGPDPGILRDRKILQTEGHPQAIVSNIKNDCKRSESVEWYHGRKSYQEKLRLSVEASGNGKPKVRAMAFTKSEQFLYHKQKTFKKHNVVQETIKTCSFGQERYAMDIVDCKHFTVSDSFAAEVCDLNPNYDVNEYVNFILRWGTHVIVEAEFGTKTIKRHEINDVELFKYVLENVPEAILESSYSNTIRIIDFDVFATSPKYYKEISNVSDSLSVGTSQNPEPIALRLMSIDTVLQTKFWSNIDKLIQRNICKEETTIGDILSKQDHLVSALLQVSEYHSFPIPGDVYVEVQWPVGTYALPGVSVDYYGNAACPAGSTDGWQRTGSYTWIMESYAENKESTINTVAATISGNEVKINFCTKYEKKITRFDLDWPAGDYCIFKHGDCPTGLNEGSIVWNGVSYEGSGLFPSYRVEKGDVEMFFCCRNDSDSETPIYLPKSKEFFLLRNAGSAGCQAVSGMISSQQFIRWDTGNHKSNYARNYHPMVNINDKTDVTLYFCLYKPK